MKNSQNYLFDSHNFEASKNQTIKLRCIRYRQLKKHTFNIHCQSILRLKFSSVSFSKYQNFFKKKNIESEKPLDRTKVANKYKPNQDLCDKWKSSKKEINFKECAQVFSHNVCFMKNDSYLIRHTVLELFFQSFCLVLDSICFPLLTSLFYCLWILMQKRKPQWIFFGFPQNNR